MLVYQLRPFFFRRLTSIWPLMPTHVQLSLGWRWKSPECMQRRANERHLNDLLIAQARFQVLLTEILNCISYFEIEEVFWGRFIFCGDSLMLKSRRDTCARDVSFGALQFWSKCPAAFDSVGDLRENTSLLSDHRWNSLAHDRCFLGRNIHMAGNIRIIKLLPICSEIINELVTVPAVVNNLWKAHIDVDRSAVYEYRWVEH
jgi:hypothetical protein